MRRSVSLGSAKELLEVGVRVKVVAGSEAELGVEESEELGPDKGREVWAEVDVFHAEVEECEEDCDGLLLKPRNGKGEGEAVDIGVEGLGEGGGNDHGAVGIVALPDIEEAGEACAGHCAEVVAVEAVLAASESEDDRVARGAESEVGEVVALRLGAIAAADHKETLDLALLDSVDDLVGDGEDGVVTEADDGLGRRDR